MPHGNARLVRVNFVLQAGGQVSKSLQSMNPGDRAQLAAASGAFSPLVRLSLAYATTASRAPLTLLFALDQRFAGIVRSSREPMLAQLRLTWWRERLSAGKGGEGGSDPLLALLARWPGPPDPLAALAVGWEAMTGAAPLPGSAFLELAEARAGAFAALAVEQKNAAGAARRMALGWSLLDIAAHLSDPREQESALALARAQDWQRQALPRGLRPLAVLHGLAARAIAMENPLQEPGPGSLVRAVRIGLLGR